MSTTPTVLVNANPEPPPAPAAPAAPVAAAPDPNELLKEIETLKANKGELERAVGYWHTKASEKSAEPAKPAAPKPDEDNDILEVLATKGAKGFDELLQKRGLVRKEDVDTMISQTVAQTRAEAKLMNDYPSLTDQASDFFKATARHFQSLPENMPDRMRVAADRAALEELRAGKAAPAPPDKKTRVDAQAGDKGRRAAPAAAEANNELEITPEISSMLEAMGVSEEAYKKRAEKGVLMSSRSGR